MIEFQCLSGQKAGQKFAFDADVVIFGRDPSCTVVLDDECCSRIHARLVLKSEGLTIQDLESKNGIRVKNRVVIESGLIAGDTFTVGRSIFKVLASKPPVEAKPEELQVHQTIALSTLDAVSKSPKPGDLPEIKRSHDMMRAAYRLSQAINTTLESDVLYKVVTESIFEHFSEAEHVCLLVRQEAGAALEVVRNVNRGKAPLLPVSQSLLKRAEKEWVGLIATDAVQDSRFAHTQSIMLHGIRSLMIAPMVARGKFIGAIYVQNCSRPACFTTMDLELLTLLGTEVALSIENANLFQALQKSFFETVRSLSNALEAKDKYTHGHSQRVAAYSVGIARELGLSEVQLEQVQMAAELHDVGKIAIPEAIITKEGRLSKEEFEAIKQHPQLGVDILKPIQFLVPILPFILHHHERFSGGGYPANLKGNEIPLEARILCLADAFDAMTTQRSYNEPKRVAEALTECRKSAGTYFDPACVRALEAYLQKVGTASLEEAAKPPVNDVVEV